MKKISLRVTAVAVAALAATSAFATDGYFSHGYGMKAKGMGGASVAVTNSGFAGANNPALAAFAGGRVDLGIDLFKPSRGVVEGDGNVEDKSGSNSFLVPEFSYNSKISDKIFGGVSVYGNGGMNTDYQTGAIASLFDTGKTGIDLQQLIIAPTVAYQVSESASFGVSPLIVYQKFKAQGLTAFASNSYSAHPNNVNDQGSDSSSGVGFRIGYFSKISPELDIGLAYAPKIKMSKFSKYQGLFAQDGNFDIPENYTIGLAFQAKPNLKFAVDYQRINYSDVPSIGNPSTNLLQWLRSGGAAPQYRLGAAEGTGFGWSSIDVIKIGAEWQHSSKVTFRVGYNHSTSPITGRDVTFNIIAPGVTTEHYTLGGTYLIDKDAELTWAFMYAPKKTVSGRHLFDGMGQGRDWSQTIEMSQKSLGVQYSWKF